MGDPSRPPTPPSTSASSSAPPPPPPPAHVVTLIEPSTKKAKNTPKVFRVFRNVLRSFPIINTPVCKLPSLPGGRLPDGRSGGGGTRITGTLFGYRKGRVSLSVQESPKTLPVLVLELAMQTHVLQKELSLGMVRIALECEKRVEGSERMKLMEEPVWTMYCNGKKNGYAARREAVEEDLHVMEVLKAVSMGAGVLPMKSEAEGADGELAYMRAHFERVVGSKDSETLYMLAPDGSGNGPDLSIFFVRI